MQRIQNIKLAPIETETQLTLCLCLKGRYLLPVHSLDKRILSSLMQNLIMTSSRNWKCFNWDLITQYRMCGIGWDPLLSWLTFGAISDLLSLRKKVLFCRNKRYFVDFSVFIVSSVVSLLKSSPELLRQIYCSDSWFMYGWWLLFNSHVEYLVLSILLE